MYVPLQAPNKNFKLFGVSSDHKKRYRFQWKTTSEKIRAEDFVEAQKFRSRQSLIQSNLDLNKLHIKGNNRKKHQKGLTIWSKERLLPNQLFDLKHGKEI